MKYESANDSRPRGRTSDIRCGRKLVFPVENYDNESYGWVGWYPGFSSCRWGAAANKRDERNEVFLGYFDCFETAVNLVLAEGEPEQKLRLLEPEVKLSDTVKTEDIWKIYNVLVRNRFEVIGSVRRDGKVGPEPYGSFLHGVGLLGYHSTPRDAMRHVFAEHWKRSQEAERG